MRSILTITALCSLAGATMAQKADTAAFSRSMTIEREFAPIIRQASKLNLTPAQEVVSQPERTTATYATWQAQPMASTEVGSLPVGQVIVTPSRSQLGWVDAAFGNYLSTDVDAGIRYRGFSLDGQFHFNKGDLDLNHDKYVASGTAAPQWSSQFLLGGLRAGYAHTFANSGHLQTYVSTAGRKFHLFDWSLGTDASQLQWQREAAQRTQRDGTVRADVLYDLHRWHLSAFVARTGVDQPATSSVDVASTSFGASTRWHGRQLGRSQWGGELVLAASTGDWQGVTVKPLLHYSFYPRAGVLRRAYADVGAGYNHTPLDRLLEAYPMALLPKKADNKRLGLAGGQKIKSAFDVVDVTLGFEDNEQGFLKWRAFVRTGYTLDALVAFAYFEDGATGQPQSYGRRNVFDNRDNFLVELGASVDYEYNRFFAMSFAADYQANTEKYTSGGNPNLRTQAHVRVNTTLPLSLDLSFDGGFLREGYYVAGTAGHISKISLDPTLDLGLRADYRISDAITIYAYGRNLLCRDYDLWTLVPAQGINFHGGLRWLF